jgi:hypothetical protein
MTDSERHYTRKSLFFYAFLTVMILLVMLHVGHIWLMIRQWNHFFIIDPGLPAEFHHLWKNPAIIGSMTFQVEQNGKVTELDLATFDFRNFNEKFDVIDYRYTISSIQTDLRLLPKEQQDTVYKILADAGLTDFEKAFRQRFVEESLAIIESGQVPIETIQPQVLRTSNTTEVCYLARNFSKLAYTLAHKAMREGDHESALGIMCGIYVVASQLEKGNPVAESFTRSVADSIRIIAGYGILEIVDDLEMPPQKIRDWVKKLQCLASDTPSLADCLTREGVNNEIIQENWRSLYPCRLTESLASPGSRRFINKLRAEKVDIVRMPIIKSLPEAGLFDARWQEYRDYYWLNMNLLLPHLFYPDAYFIRGYVYYEQSLIKLTDLIQLDLKAKQLLNLAILSLLLRSWQIEHGSSPASLSELERLNGAPLPVEPATSMPFPYNASAAKIIEFDVEGGIQGGSFGPLSEP